MIVRGIQITRESPAGFNRKIPEIAWLAIAKTEKFRETFQILVVSYAVGERRYAERAQRYEGSDRWNKLLRRDRTTRKPVSEKKLEKSKNRKSPQADKKRKDGGNRNQENAIAMKKDSGNFKKLCGSTENG